MATLDVALKLLFRLCPQGPDLVSSLGPHRRQKLLGRHSSGLQLLLRTLLSFADDIGGCRLQPSLIDDFRGLRPGSGSRLLGFLLRPRQQQSSTFQRRLSLQATALHKSLRLRLPLGRCALAGSGLLAELAGLLRRAADAKPLTHQLQMPVDFGRVIALADKPEVALDHVRRAGLAFLARHALPFAAGSATPLAIREGLPSKMRQWFRDFGNHDPADSA